MSHSLLRPTGLCVVIIGLLAARSIAAPTISNLSVRGLQSGAVTTLVVEGAELLPDPKLVLGVPLASQSAKPGATAQRVEFELTLDPAAATGIHQLRLATPGGISNAVPIAVDTLPQAAFAAEIKSLPVALTGSLGGNQVQRTSFNGRKGENLVVEIEARRLASALNPVIHLYDERDVQLTWAQTTIGLAGDARLALQLPADGKYTIEIHDALYQGGNPGYFRLKVGDLKFADSVLPIAVKRGAKSSLELTSTNLPAGTKVEVQVPAGGSDQPAPLPKSPGVTGLQPRVVATDLDEAVETTPPAMELQKVTAPLGISGKLAAKAEEDKYLVAVTPGQTLRLDVLASRIGSPLDGVLYVRNEQGQQLATNDDRPGTTDPGLDFAVPAGVSTIVVAIKDLTGRGGEEFLYRIAIAEANRPDLSLTVSESRHNIPEGGASLLKVQAARAGYNGPIRLEFAGLPAGVNVSGAEIPAGASNAIVTLTGATGARGHGVVRVTGSSAEASVAIARPGLLPAAPFASDQPWLLGELGVALVAPAPLAIAWVDSSADTGLPLGAKLTAPVKVSRAEGTTGAVRLSLITSQPIPKKTIKENNVDKVVDDVESTLRFEGTPSIAADKAEGEATILVPGNLPNLPYDLAIQAELLAADGKTVVTTAVTPARRLSIVTPFRIELAGEPKVEARAGLGATGKLTGKVVRLGGFQGPLKVTLAGVPAEYRPPSIEVPADKSDFELPVAFAYGSKPGELTGGKLVALHVADPARPDAAARSNEIPLAINVVPGEKPPGEPPLAIFEDGPEFVANLNQGAGQATLLPEDKYSGTASVKVTPDQRYNPALPGLGVKIREKPGDGEYRWLRYAWKKKGGSQVCFQINHDGQWGPVGGKPGKFRYHSGPGPECFGASENLAKELPGEWVVVTRDLFADFGEFTMSGLALSPMDGEYALFDHIYLGKSPEDLDTVKPAK